MQLLHFSDPTSFKIPMIGSGLIIGILLFLLSYQWIGEEDRVVKVPDHIAARIVHINKPKPKVAPIKKTQTKPSIPKKTIKADKPKPKPVPKAKEPEKTVVNKQADAKPIPLPGADFFEALEKEEAQNSLNELLEKEAQAKQAEYEQEQVTDFSSQINALIQAVWRFPPSAKHDEEVILRIYLVPTGEVTEVALLQTSGNEALDRSAEQAVWKVGHFPVPQDSVLFEKEFRQIVLKLKPENARL